MKKLLLGIVCLGIGRSGLAASTFDWSGEPLRKAQLETIAFRGWIPDGSEPLQGTLVLIPGRHGDGRGMADDPRWQSLASSLHFAILACQFSNGDPGLYQHDAEGEVAKAIDSAVENLGKESAHPELDKAPLAFWGTSAGSNVSSRYCKHNPGRVAAFASSKGTWGPGADLPGSASEIPMFFAIGEKDKAEWTTGSLQNIDKSMKSQSPWTLALSRTEGHGVGTSLDVAIPFLEASISARLGKMKASADTESRFKSELPAIGSAARVNKSPGKLQKIDRKDGWLGDPKSYEVAPYQDYKGSKSKAIWLPDEATALAWQSYLRQ